MAEEEFQEEEASPETLITFYGEFWSPDLVNWEEWKMPGRFSKVRGQDVNVYEQRGIYVLYRDFEVVYVGKAIEQSIGWRLASHRKNSRKGPRWDRFSWFGLLEIDDATDKRSKKAVRSRLEASRDQVIETLEALLIMISDPKLNSRREKVKGAKKLFQSDTHAEPTVSERLATIENLLNKLAQ